MTYASLVGALDTVLSSVPGVETVVRGDELRLGTRGSVLPKVAQTPAVRIRRTLRGRGKEQPLSQDGDRQRYLPYLIDVWDYTTQDDDVATAAGDFLGLVDALQERIRSDRRLGGLADTETSKLFQAYVTGDEPQPQPLGVNNSKGLLHAAFTVECWEWVAA